MGLRAMKRMFVGFLMLILSATGAISQSQKAADAVARAMKSIQGSKWDAAYTEMEPAGQVGHDIVDWYKLRAGKGEFSEYRDFLERNADWPGLPLMRRQGEPSISVNANAQQVIEYFATQDPSSGSGALRLIMAYKSIGANEKAQAEAIRAWTTVTFGSRDQDILLSLYGEQLRDHHAERYDMLLWKGKSTQAARMSPLISKGRRALGKARLGLMNKSKGVDGLVAAVPKEFAADPGLAHARFTWRAKKGLQDRAIELMRQRSISAESLGQPEEWANRRRSYARQEMRNGKSELAYELASRHYLSAGRSYSDLEWLSGFIALTYLNDPKTALGHFQNFRVSVDTPISLGRAGYWEGRAYEALNQPENAQASYEFGGEYQTSFYGQLAAEKAGLPTDPALTGREDYPDFRESPHFDSSVMQAALLFQKAGHPLLFTRFTRQLAESLNTQERGSLAQLALDLDETYSALYMAKYAANNGTVLMRPYYPVTDIADGNLPVATELALAIARRESEFYSGSKSPVGARGLMQLMPRTGKAMANKLGLSFSVDRLVEDPVYNAKLGSAYLAELIDEFGTALPLVAAGYNAGPSRPKTWMKLYGDPRSDSVDAVIWVEHIPFRETRNYVMRVMESLPVYRARLTGKTAPLRLSKELKGL